MIFWISEHSPEHKECIFYVKVLLYIRKKTGEQSNCTHPNNRETRILFQFLPRSFSALSHYHRLFIWKSLYLFHLLFNLRIGCKSDLKCSDYPGNSDTWVIPTDARTTFAPCPSFSWDKASLCFQTAKFLHSIVCHSKVICRVPQTSCWHESKHLPSGNSWLVVNAVFVSSNSVKKVKQIIS